MFPNCCNLFEVLCTEKSFHQIPERFSSFLPHLKTRQAIAVGVSSPGRSAALPYRYGACRKQRKEERQHQRKLTPLLQTYTDIVNKKSRDQRKAVRITTDRDFFATNTHQKYLSTIKMTNSLLSRLKTQRKWKKTRRHSARQRIFSLQTIMQRPNDPKSPLKDAKDCKYAAQVDEVGDGATYPTH